MKKHFWLSTAMSGVLAICVAAEETATVNRNRVNVRGGPTFGSEVITQLQKGDQVVVLEEIPAENPKPDEPKKWVAIKLPPHTAVWVFTAFLDDEKIVKVKKLNLRAGPGENFSILGSLKKGDAVAGIRTLDEWMEIEAPEGTKAYVDESYLTRTNAAAPAPAAVAAAPATSVAVAAAEPVAERAVSPEAAILQGKPVVYEPPAKPTANPVANKPEPVTTPPPAEEKPEEKPKAVKSDPEPKPVEKVTVTDEPTPAKAVEQAAPPPKPEENIAQPVVEKPKVEEKKAVEPSKAEPAPVPPPVETAPEPARVLPKVAEPIAARTSIVTVKRTVRREGEVRSTKFNIQAPTYFELVSKDTGKVINYLNADKAGFKLKDYKGLRVVVTGEELLDARFPDRPMLDVETIEVAP